MYLPAVHAEHHVPTLRDFIRANPLGILTTAIDSPSFPFLQSSHIPWVLDIQDETSETELGVLRGHMARANPQSKSLMEHLSSAKHPTASETTTGPRKLERDVIILFNGPAHHYVTPKFYVYGKLSVYFDKSESTSTFLSKAIADLSQMAETQIIGNEKPWEVDDAPPNFINLLQRAIIGIEVEITDMAGKWKMSQEMREGDNKGVEDGFTALNTETGRKMAEMVKTQRRVTQKS